jgi:hypothetical protein
LETLQVFHKPHIAHTLCICPIHNCTPIVLYVVSSYDK